jgi:hypothetical protein
VHTTYDGMEVINIKTAELAGASTEQHHSKFKI